MVKYEKVDSNICKILVIIKWYSINIKI